METPISLIESRSPSDAYHMRNGNIIQPAMRRLQILYLKSRIAVYAKLFMACRLTSMLVNRSVAQLSR